jgi:TolB-like protein
VETIPRRGYRFLVPVEVVTNEDCEQVESSIVLPPKREGLGARLSRLRWAAVILLVPVLALSVLYLFRPRPLRSVGPSTRRVVLVILPFENLSGDSAQDYLCQGFSEELETQLSRADPNKLAVIARVTAAAYARNRTIAEIGRDLHADYVLRGSVRRDATHVRVTAQLIRVLDQSHVWDNEFDRQLDSIISVQSEVAGEIAQQVRSSIIIS